MAFGKHTDFNFFFACGHREPSPWGKVSPQATDEAFGDLTVSIQTPSTVRSARGPPSPKGGGSNNSHRKDHFGLFSNGLSFYLLLGGGVAAACGRDGRSFFAFSIFPSFSVGGFFKRLSIVKRVFH